MSNHGFSHLLFPGFEPSHFPDAKMVSFTTSIHFILSKSLYLFRSLNKNSSRLAWSSSAVLASSLIHFEHCGPIGLWSLKSKLLSFENLAKLSIWFHFQLPFVGLIFDYLFNSNIISFDSPRHWNRRIWRRCRSSFCLVKDSWLAESMVTDQSILIWLLQQYILW